MSICLFFFHVNAEVIIPVMNESGKNNLADFIVVRVSYKN